MSDRYSIRFAAHDDDGIAAASPIKAAAQREAIAVLTDHNSLRSRCGGARLALIQIKQTGRGPG